MAFFVKDVFLFYKNGVFYKRHFPLLQNPIFALIPRQRRPASYLLTQYHVITIIYERGKKSIRDQSDNKTRLRRQPLGRSVKMIRSCRFQRARRLCSPAAGPISSMKGCQSPKFRDGVKIIRVCHRRINCRARAGCPPTPFTRSALQPSSVRCNIFTSPLINAPA